MNGGLPPCHQPPFFLCIIMKYHLYIVMTGGWRIWHCFTTILNMLFDPVEDMISTAHHRCLAGRLNEGVLKTFQEHLRRGMFKKDAMGTILVIATVATTSHSTLFPPRIMMRISKNNHDHHITHVELS